MNQLYIHIYIHIHIYMCVYIYIYIYKCERLLLNHEKTLEFLASGGEELNPGPEMRLDHSELLCNKVLLKYKGDRESF